jgi:hypothetical protein
MDVCLRSLRLRFYEGCLARWLMLALSCANLRMRLSELEEADRKTHSSA